jgi:flagellar hook-length control protein FliK
LRREAGDGDPASGLVAGAEPVAMRAALRTEISSAATAPVIADVEISTPAALDLAIASPRLGAVRIGIEGGAGDLKVSLGLSPAAAALVAADAPRLIADLAAGGVRLQSLDVSGGGGQQQSPSHQAPASPHTAAAPLAMNPIAARPSTADRYA